MAIPGTPGTPGRKAWDDDDLTRLDSIKNKRVWYTMMLSFIGNDYFLLSISLSYLSSSLPTESIRPASKSKSAQSRRDTNGQTPSIAIFRQKTGSGDRNHQTLFALWMQDRNTEIELQ
jgi:hypothetical protein